MDRTRIAIACQGGGSQCAFVAGALRTLFDEGVHRRFEIVGLSGTSGGALTAAVAWIGMLKQARGDRTPIGARVIACWKDISAQSPQEILLDRTSVQLQRLAERGLLPTFATSPSSLPFRLWSESAALLIARPEFTDLRALMLKHIDFDALPSLLDRGSPTLLVGAGDVLEGTFKIFSSVAGEIKVESLLASAAVPTLFPAVQVDGHFYWDGIFASNPPVTEFLRKGFMGSQKWPEEIWIIQVNPFQYHSVPEAPSEIFDRRNHLAGNLSLRHELQVIDMVNLLLQEGALTDEFRDRFNLNLTRPIKVRFVRMSEELQQMLDYPSKLSRHPGFISRLIADGDAQAKAFLDELGSAEISPDFSAEQAAMQTH